MVTIEELTNILNQLDKDYEFGVSDIGYDEERYLIVKPTVKLVLMSNYIYYDKNHDHRNDCYYDFWEEKWVNKDW